MKRKTRESKKDRVRKGVSGRGRWRERCEVNCEIKLEVKTAEMIKNARGAVRLFPTFNEHFDSMFLSYYVRHHCTLFRRNMSSEFFTKTQLLHF